MRKRNGLSRRITFGLLVILAMGLGQTTHVCHGQEAAAAGTTPEAVDFGRDIRPLLAAKCFGCHGEQMQESNYRLDVRETALGTADFGDPPIVPGDADASPLTGYIAGTSDYGIVMPPDEEDRLTADQVALVRRWIDQGAEWPDALAGSADGPLTTDHWSFQPLERPEAPLPPSETVVNPIDAFIQHRLAESDLTCSPREDRRSLIRRVYLDMHGLPPTPAQIEQFANDTSPDAYVQLVERVLNSPRYGERWARHWLDIVRFGESHGFETNPERTNAYHYRDYVIDAFNSDKPYDQFIREQIAGDALGADAATGFLVGGPYDQVKSPDINLTLMQRQDELADIVNTTGTAFLGLTVGCARCHNHKFDPILQKDYYSLQAVFAGVQHGERPLRSAVSEEAVQELAALGQEIEHLRQQLADWKERAPAATPTAGKRPPVQVSQNTEEFPAVDARWVRMTIRATSSGGEPCIDELEIYAVSDDDSQVAQNVALASTGAVPTASGTLPGYDIHKLEHINDGLTGNDHSWISDTAGQGWIQIELPEIVTIDRIVWGRARDEQYRDRLATDYIIEVAASPGEWIVVATSQDRAPLSQAAEAPFAFLDRLPAELADQARQAYERLQQHESRVQQLNGSMPMAYVGTFVQPGETFRLYRGDPMAPREQVAPDALSVISSLGLTATTPEQQRRVALANWIASGENPLTARVIVNRLWHYHFGTGMVSTPSDFGANGTAPSHPQLLDWLASELQDNSWSLKHIHRLILQSHTYCQSSAPRPDGLAKDAASRLLWRFPPRRLEAEAIRDCILHVAGTLNLQAGGPGFKVFDVKKETVHHYFPKKEFGPAEWRRMIYMTKIRQEQDAVFGAFDCPDGGQVIPKRSRSTTPLQALNLLNSKFLLEQADFLAKRLQEEAGGDGEAQVRRAFQLLFGRPPSDQELSTSAALIRDYGLSAFCRALLNANEFLFIS